jgi:hypothetical protein
MLLLATPLGVWITTVSLCLAGQNFTCHEDIVHKIKKKLLDYRSIGARRSGSLNVLLDGHNREAETDHLLI